LDWFLRRGEWLLVKEIMSDLVESIKRGLEEAVVHRKGEKTGVRLFTSEEVNVKKVRGNTALTQ
jgi:hypothetical protein